jgi:hypothetical protein
VLARAHQLISPLIELFNHRKEPVSIGLRREAKSSISSYQSSDAISSTVVALAEDLKEVEAKWRVGHTGLVEEEIGCTCVRGDSNYLQQETAISRQPREEIWTQERLSRPESNSNHEGSKETLYISGKDLALTRYPGSA